MKVYLIIPERVEGVVSVKGFLFFRRFKKKCKIDLEEKDLPKQLPGGRIGLVVEVEERL